MSSGLRAIAKNVWTQLGPGNLTARCSLDWHAVLGRNTLWPTMEPIPDMWLLHADGSGQCSLPSGDVDSFLEWGLLVHRLDNNSRYIGVNNYRSFTFDNNCFKLPQ